MAKTNMAMELRKCCNHAYAVGNGIDVIDQEEEKLLGAAGASHESKTHLAEFLVSNSCKMVFLHQILPRLRKGGHRVLIFSQFTSMLKLIKDYLDAMDMPVEVITGDVAGVQRQRVIDRFSAPAPTPTHETANDEADANNDNDNSPFVMLLSTKAGGVGINLTAADTAIIYDSDWNPQNDIQAMARCHRIGQTKPVKIFRLITSKTYEQTMFQRASLKLGLEKAVLTGVTDSGSGSNANNPSSEELQRMLREGAYGMVDDEEDSEEDEDADHDDNNADEHGADSGQQKSKSKSKEKKKKKSAQISEADLDGLLCRDSGVTGEGQLVKGDCFARASFKLKDKFLAKAKKQGVEGDTLTEMSLTGILKLAGVEKPVMAVDAPLLQRKRKQVGSYCEAALVGAGDDGDSDFDADADADANGQSKSNVGGIKWNNTWRDRTVQQLLSFGYFSTSADGLTEAMDQDDEADDMKQEQEQEQQKDQMQKQKQKQTIEKEEGGAGDAEPRPRCSYGASCYRKSPAHKAQYCHPHDSDWDRTAPPTSIVKHVQHVPPCHYDHPERDEQFWRMLQENANVGTKANNDDAGESSWKAVRRFCGQFIAKLVVAAAFEELEQEDKSGIGRSKTKQKKRKKNKDDNDEEEQEEQEEEIDVWAPNVKTLVAQLDLLR
jgi:hypothetical protein